MEFTVEATIVKDNGQEFSEDILVEEIIEDQVNITIPSLDGYITVETKTLMDAIKAAVLRGKGLL